MLTFDEECGFGIPLGDWEGSIATIAPSHLIKITIQSNSINVTILRVGVVSLALEMFSRENSLWDSYTELV